MKDYKNQIAKILDISKVEFRNNGEWWFDFKMKDFILYSKDIIQLQLRKRKLMFWSYWDCKIRRKKIGRTGRSEGR